MVDQPIDSAGVSTASIHIDGGKKARRHTTQSRIWFSIGVVALVFLVIVGQLVSLGLKLPEATNGGSAANDLTAARPEIVDRNGVAMAMDIEAPSLVAEPRDIIDVDEAVEKIHAELPELKRDWLRDRLDGDEGFAYIQREVSPATEERIFNLGLPGIYFERESSRFYPAGPTAAHILGAVNVDNQGIAGVERSIDRILAQQTEEEVATGEGLDTSEPVVLSVDMRVQTALHAELIDAMERYQAIAAAGVIVDVKTGEVLGMASLPEFDPNEPASALEDGRYNRITAATYELGSTFKTITFAAALDSGLVTLSDEFDARTPLRYGGFTINDFHAQRRILSATEVFRYSSNIGTVLMMETLGQANYRSFLTKIGFDDPLSVELPETKRSYILDEFSEIAAATASFGHGLAVTPLHMASAVGALVNDGYYVPATLFKRDEAAARAIGRQVVSPLTSSYIRYLLRLNALEGSGRRMNNIAAGYLVGGKTGTAEKVVDGVYSSEKSLTVFASAFPLDAPQYAMVILVDEPKRENEQSGRTAGWNAGEVTGRVVQRIAPLLGIEPDFSDESELGLVPTFLRE